MRHGKLYRQGLSIRQFLLCVVFFLILSVTAWGSISVTQSNSTATLSSEFKQMSPGQTSWLLFQVTMAPGWHAYWQNPGDSGLAPTFKWQSPPGVHVGATQWLPPTRIKLGPLANFGYKKTASYLFPITIDKVASGLQTVRLQAEWLVCQRECVPQKGTFELTLNVATPTVANAIQPHILQLLDRRARRFPDAVTYALSGDQLQLKLPVDALSLSPTARLFFFPTQDSVIKPAAKQSWKRDGQSVVLTMSRDFAAPTASMTGVLAVSQPGLARVTHYTIDAQAQNAPASVQSFWAAVVLALLGGILLNAMPCVFPILALKAISLSHADASARRVQAWHGVVYTLGVMFSFAILVAVLLFLKQAGHAVGWGYQMQSPVTIAVLIYLFLLVSLNLAGVFSVGERVMGLGQSLTQSKGYGGSFFTGVLATVVATPCTAPFMGAAIGYALLQPAWVSASVMMALGLGMALPLLLISLLPGLARILPRPGAWMETFKQCMCFPMLLAMVWLLWVLMQQVAPSHVMWVMVGLVCVTFCLWCWHRLALTRRLSQIMVLLVFAVVCLYPIYRLTQVDVLPAATAASQAQVFSKDRLQALLAAHQPVFVNVTAAWCLTCKYNEALHFNQRFYRFLSQHHITYLKADWTNRDLSILTYLQTFDRSGVPLYVVYDRQGHAHVLPQLLTDKVLYGSLNRSSSL